MVMGMGQYPNLATQDCFASVCSRRRAARGAGVEGARRPHGHERRAVPRRGDRAAAQGAVRVRSGRQGSTEEGGGPLTFDLDLVWDGAMPPFEEPHHYVRRTGRVYLRHDRFAQTGCWERHARGRGRDARRHPRSLEGHPRPVVGRAPATARSEPAGIRAGTGSMAGMWNYDADAVRRLLDPLHVKRKPSGTRALEEACASGTTPTRPRVARPARVRAHLEPGTRMIRKPLDARRSRRHRAGRSTIDVTPLLPQLHRDRHRLRHRRRLAPRHVPGTARRCRRVSTRSGRDRSRGRLHGSSTTSRASHQSTGDVGYGLHEHGFFGSFPKYGMDGPHDGASA